MKDNKLTWCGVEVTEEEYERLAQEYLRQFAEAEFVPEAEETEAVLVVTEPARVGKIR